MGVTIERSKAGNGQDYPKKGDEVSIHYVGTLENGKKYATTHRVVLLSPVFEGTASHMFG